MAPDLRSARLKRFFFTIIDGKRRIETSDDARLFLAAVCDQEDRAQCIVTLLSKKHALKAFHKSLCIDLSDKFLNGPGAQCMEYFANEDIRQLNGGQLLRDLLHAILVPPLLWEAFRTAATTHRLSDEGLHAFACLLLELLIVLPPTSEMRIDLSIRHAGRSILENNRLLESPVTDLRRLGYKIQEAICSLATSEHQIDHLASKPGGRHDNDFEDFRKIAVFPTTDELLAEQPPFMLPADTVLDTDPHDRVATHLDNQFRLLREDMLAELREDLKHATTSTHGGRKCSLRLRGLQLSGMEIGTSPRLKPAAIALRCWDGIFRSLPKGEEERKKYFIDNKGFIKHGAFGCLMTGKDVVAFATIDRDEDFLAMNPPVILLRVFGHAAIRTALLTMKTKRPHEIDFVLIDTPFFAYEPVLACLQSMPSLPMAEVILNLADGGADTRSFLGLDALAAEITQREQLDLRTVLNLPRETRLDHSQTLSLVTGLTKPVSLIQGPPGTGKSFIGAILSKAFLDHTTETILVLCYTNHALDQFLEDILDMGVTGEDMLRLGSKSTTRTQALGLYEQTGKKVRLSQFTWRLRQCLFDDAENSSRNLQKCGHSFSRWRCSDKDLLESLEFADENAQFFNALSVPDTSDGMVMVDAAGKAVDSLYLLDRWRQGKDVGVFQAAMEGMHQDVWAMSPSERAQCYARWVKDATSERVDLLCETIREYDHDYHRWAQLRDGRAAEVMKTKRLIGCTTTAAAKYAKQLASARPGIVLVEEAGEVLESHVLTAMCHETKHLVLIGDHLQLRPKVNNFALTVERGDGYNLNRSLFERLVVGGHLHTVLTKQHRMRPEISALVRRLMYQDLEDNTTTLSRPNVRGLQSNVVFIDHEELEVSDERLKDRQDGGSNGSRQNPHEVKMVLKIVRYLAQQGYGTDKQVVLTPYLGQLRLLIDNLKADHDPVLSDLDSHNLVKAGLLTPAGAHLAKRQLRVSTVDNYQGEESDIVIVSLTRSNKTGDIGFLSAPQRLNVLLSRARNGLILIGNATTFRSSKKGRAVWDPFFMQLVRAGQFFDGLPVQCEHHADKRVSLKSPEDFDVHCPNGGCELPCRAVLKCGKHRCPEKCHQLVDHSKMQCKQVEVSQCSQGHKVMWECWQSSKPCSTCDRLAKEREARQQRDLKLAERREQKKKAYLEKLQALDNEIADQHSVVQDHNDEADRGRMLEQKRKDLAQAKKLAQGKQQENTPIPKEKSVQPSPDDIKKERKSTTLSRAADQWEYQKTYENVSNEHIDALMSMIGLESVKQKVLDVKDKIDTSLRQGASLQKERFNVVLLGNPGTGKTTVARLYAKCLAYMGAVAGNVVEETTASRLTNGGVPAFKKLIEKVLNDGGGAIFIDEAYQLATGSSATGSQILDALLDEAENLTGKVVFILAGYKQEMENVFSHNPGLPSRFPHEFVFEDYKDWELLQIFQKQIQERFDGRMRVEGGINGLFCRIVARRVGYGRGRPGFGNARAVENAFAKIRSRQAARVSNARRKGEQEDDFLLTKEDLNGPEVSTALESSQAWADLKSLIGLTAVKQSVNALMQSVRYNYERELREEARLDFNLNRVFLGSPGTGKTTVAKLYGRTLADLGLLSNGQVVVKNPSDFLGDALGVSEKKTRGVLTSTVGKVLVIDEAYSLYSSSANGGQAEDPYKTAVIDTLVAEIQSVPGEDRCILLLGYRSQMETMMQKVNPGLTRRFPLSEAFVFEDFTDDEMKRVVEFKLKEQAYTVTDQAMETIMAVLQRARNKPHFGNAGEVDILLNTAKERHQQRQALVDSPHNAVLEAVDIDPDFGRTHRKSSSVRALFEGTVGNEELILRLEGIQKAASNMRARGLDPRDQVPFNYLFVGPPGTGKTSTARKMGKIYYDMGILGSDEVMEISATELVGEYVGRTGPKTQQQLEKALGKVLFIDEAYRLAEGHFSKEAIDEIVDRLTKPNFARRLIVILAGYDHDMERLIGVNRGLRSRFPDFVNFRSLQPQDCFSLIISLLAREPFLDISSLRIPQESFAREAIARFDILTKLDDWANARDVETLAKSIARDQLYNADSTSDALLVLTEEDVLTALDEMLQERRRRVALAPRASMDRMSPALPSVQQLLDSQSLKPPALPKVNTPATTVVQDLSEDVQIEEVSINDVTERRDAGVPDEVWARLEFDKRRTDEEKQHYEEIVTRQTDLEQAQAIDEPEEVDMDGTSDDQSSDYLEGMRRLEHERLAREVSRRQREEELESLRRKRAELEREREKERKVQRKLRDMGVCVAGFRWIKQASGYRCAGGSHYVSNESLDAL